MERVSLVRPRKSDHRCRMTAVVSAVLLSLAAGQESHPAYAQSAACAQVAVAAVSFTAQCTGLSCTFTVNSPAPAGADFAWDFGDGNTSDGSATQAQNSYAAALTYLVTLTATDANGQVSVATGTVTLAPSPQLAADDAFQTDLNTPLTITTTEMLANDAPGVIFVQIDPVAAAKCYIPAGGTSCVYRPQYVGTDSFTYTVKDLAGHTGSATVTITVLPALVANPDFFTIQSAGSIQITSTQLLSNDTPGANLVSVQDAENGTLTLVSAGPPATYNFSVPPCFTGDASFDYFISRDSSGSPPFARGTVTITSTNAPPTASFWVTCNGLTCMVDSTSNDPGCNLVAWGWNWGDGTTMPPTGPTQSNLTPWQQQHTYTQSGRYTITLTVIDSVGLSGSTQLAALANDPPVAGNDTATTIRDTPVTIDVLANDSDPDGDSPTITNVNLSAYPGASYQIVQQPSGHWVLQVTPPNAFVGTMTFTYQACDVWGACSAPATVTLTVTSAAVNALGDQFYCPQNGSIQIPVATLLSNDYQVNQQPLTIVSYDTSILMGTLSCTSTECTYTPPINGAGYTIFRYTISDPNGNQDTAPVRIYVGTQDQAPTASPIFLTTTWNTPVTFTINDLAFKAAVDGDGDTLTIVVQTQKTAFGNLVCSVPMYICTYTPNTGYAGTDRFTYSASDMLNPAVTSWINVLTLPLATATFDARGGVVATGVNQAAFVGAGTLANDYLPNGGPETVTAFSTTGMIGSLSNCSASGCTYTPPISFQGTTSFTYTATDGHGATDTAVVKICVGCTNHAPVAVAQALSTPKNTPLRFSVFDIMHGDYDPDNDPLFVTFYTQTAHLGTLTCTSPGYWCTYTPNANTTGADAMTYVLSDVATSVTSTVTITITP